MEVTNVPAPGSTAKTEHEMAIAKHEHFLFMQKRRQNLRVWVIVILFVFGIVAVSGVLSLSRLLHLRMEAANSNVFALGLVLTSLTLIILAAVYGLVTVARQDD